MEAFPLRNFTQFNALNVTKLVILLISFVGFVYQSWIAAIQYLAYETVSAVKLVDENVIEYPGVTICFMPMISDSKLEELYPDYRCIRKDPNCTIKLEKQDEWNSHYHF